MNSLISLITAGVMVTGITAALLTPNNETVLPSTDVSSVKPLKPVVKNPLAPFTKVKFPTRDQPGNVEPVDIEKMVRSGVSLYDPSRHGQWASFEDMHTHYTRSFVESEGNGISRAITFNEPYQRQLLVNGKRHRVIRLNLIGLMNEPVVYKAQWVNVLRNKLTSYETRELSAIENKAVRFLADGEPHLWLSPEQSGAKKEGEAIHNDSASEIEQPVSGTLIAGLRATSSCVSCHDVKPNALLGAFIYELQPVLPPKSQLTKEQVAAIKKHVGDKESTIADAK